MGRLIDETDLMNLLSALSDARHDLSYAIKKVPELPPVEAIPKAEYEARLKADLKAILVELQLEIEELDTPNNGSAYMDCVEIIQQKINSLKGEQ